MRSHNSSAWSMEKSVLALHFQNILLFSLTFTKVNNWSIATHQTVQTADCKTLTGNMWFLTAAFTFWLQHAKNMQNAVLFISVVHHYNILVALNQYLNIYVVDGIYLLIKYLSILH